MRRAVVPASLLVAVLVVGWSPPADAAMVTNYTFHVPATVQTNPCEAGDIVNLDGDIHVVITSTANRAGGYRVTNHLNSHMSGESIITGLPYTSSETSNSTWLDDSPFPAVDTEVYNWNLISRGSADNYVLHTTMHTTVDASGTPTAVVDDAWMDCQG
jgi:hypothetical protein